METILVPWIAAHGVLLTIVILRRVMGKMTGL